MIVSEIMTRDVILIGPDDSVGHAAKIMNENDCGFLPVARDDRLIGTITDRDIALRVIGADRGPDCSVGEAMSNDVRYCFDDDDVSHVAENMGDIQVRRLPVVDRDKRLVGVVALGDFATEAVLYEEAADALGGISRANHDGASAPRQW